MEKTKTAANAASAKLKQRLILMLPVLALGLLLIALCAVVSAKGYRLDMYLNIVFNEGVVLAVVATGAVFIYSLGSFDISRIRSCRFMMRCLRL